VYYGAKRSSLLRKVENYALKALLNCALPEKEVN
jgi:hypothetical protein